MHYSAHTVLQKRSSPFQVSHHPQCVFSRDTSKIAQCIEMHGAIDICSLFSQTDLFTIGAAYYGIGSDLNLCTSERYIIVNEIHHMIFFLLWRCDPTRVMTSFLRFSRSHTTHYRRQDSSGRVISWSQRCLPDNTQHSQQTNIHAPRWDSNPRSQQASGSRPTPQTRGHWHRHIA